VIAREDRFESKRVELNVSKSSPLYPTVRTSTRRAAASLIGQKATFGSSRIPEREHSTINLPLSDEELPSIPFQALLRARRAVAGLIHHVSAVGGQGRADIKSAVRAGQQ
jgi:hypothetical protein